MDKNAIPKATLGRLPKYLQYLKNLSEDSPDTISAAALARGLSLGEVQVRKDLASVSGGGRPKVGYIKSELIQDIEDRLGCNSLTPAVLVGAGKLGRALLDYNGFEEYGVRIVAAFDCNDKLVRKEGGDSKDILPVSEIYDFCRDNSIRLGIITVGEGSAQSVCDMLVKSGIDAIWNFAPYRLVVPEGVLLKQENLALSLAYLNNQLHQ